MAKWIVCLFLIFCHEGAWAQQASAKENNLVKKYGPRRQISTIVYMGLAGAVLGLSTLSFYGRPQDHLSNIPIGFGVGVVAGTIYMTYQAATNPDEFYRSENQYIPDFKEQPVEITTAADLFFRPTGPSFSHSWEF